MSNEVEKFDPSTLMQGVKDRIKATFVSMIPDVQWEQIVGAEVDSFLKKSDTSYNHNRDYKSPLDVLIRQELNEWAKGKFAEYLQSEGMKTTWDENGKPVASEAVKKMILENSGQMLLSLFGGLFQTMMNDYALKQQRGY